MRQFNGTHISPEILSLFFVFFLITKLTHLLSSGNQLKFNIPPSVSINIWKQSIQKTDRAGEGGQTSYRIDCF